MNNLKQAYKLLNQLLLESDYILKNMQDFSRLSYAIDRLQRNGFSDEMIYAGLLQANLSIVTPEKLPETFWKDSLLNNKAFYFHPFLRLTTPSPRFDTKTKKFIAASPYLEMRIRFQTDDFLKYLYETLQTPYVLRQEKRDTGAFFHLLEKYNHLFIEKTKVEGIDYILFLIDWTKKKAKTSSYLTLLECENRYGAEALEYFTETVTQIIANHYNKCRYKGETLCGV